MAVVFLVQVCLGRGGDTVLGIGKMGVKILGNWENCPKKLRNWENRKNWEMGKA